MPRPNEATTQTSHVGPAESDVRDYLAEERTFLAWIRTILGLMGLGFLLARVDRSSLWLGLTLIAIGAALSLLAIQRYRRTVEELNHLRPRTREPSRQGVFLAQLLAVAGVAMAVHLALS